MELTGKQLETLNFRRRRLTDKVRGLEAVISGREVDLLPQVRDSEGNYSEEKTRALVEELLEAWELALRYQSDQAWKDTPEDGPLPPLLESEDRQKKRAFFRSFLYCALRIIEHCPTWLMSASGTYDDILRIARRMEYTDRIDLYYAEHDPSSEADGFFGVMDEAYLRLAKRPILSSASEEDLEELRRRYGDEIREQEEYEELLEELAHIEDPLEQDAYMREHLGYTDDDDEEPVPPDEEELRRAEKFHSWLDEQAEAVDRWVRDFPAREELCREYLRCRELYFQASAWSRLPETVEQFLDIYLYAWFGAGLMDDDNFFAAYAMLDQTLTQIQQLLE